jgi:hypothetical protein
MSRRFDRSENNGKNDNGQSQQRKIESLTIYGKNNGHRGTSFSL